MDLLDQVAFRRLIQNILRDCRQLPPVVPFADEVLYFAECGHQPLVGPLGKLQSIVQQFQLDAKEMDIIGIEWGPSRYFLS